MSRAVTVVDHGAGNLASVVRALERVGAEVVVSSDPQGVANAERLVVPGQGAFPDAMERLTRGGLADAIQRYTESERPYLGICLGLQLLFESGEEQRETRGLGVLQGRVARLPRAPGVKLPHMGWNTVSGPPPIPHGEHFYFVHSYVVLPAPGLDVWTTEHAGVEFVSAVRRDALFAVQFHPEKSHRAGLALLQTWLQGGA